MRGRLARSNFKFMRREAKDLGKLQMSNEALKEEIEQLRARAKDDTRRVLVEAGERSVVSR
jgi:cell division protein FtsB